METKVVNLKFDPYDFYIGRSTGTIKHYGNPFSHLPHSLAKVIVGTVDEAVQAYEDWLVGTKYQEIEPERRKWILAKSGRAWNWLF